MSFNITPVASGYQEIHPYSAMDIDSVKINTSLIMMKECAICFECDAMYRPCTAFPYITDALYYYNILLGQCSELWIVYFSTVPNQLSLHLLDCTSMLVLVHCLCLIWLHALQRREAAEGWKNNARVLSEMRRTANCHCSYWSGLKYNTQCSYWTLHCTLLYSTVYCTVY